MQKYMQSIQAGLSISGKFPIAYYDFFDRYGTHVISKLKLGSSFGYRFELKVEEANKMAQQRFSVEASASYFCNGGSFGIEKENTRQEQFKKSVKSWKSFSVGALPDPNIDVSKWATQTVNNPMPVGGKLISIPDALETFTKNDASLDKPTIDNLKSKFNQYIQTYCNDRLLKQGKVVSCSDSDAKINNLSTSESFETEFDSLTKNGRIPIVWSNAKSSRFMTQKPDGLGYQPIQKYYTGGDNFQWFFIKTGVAKNQYYIKSKAIGKCLAPSNCSFDNGAVINLTECDTIRCQMWEMLPQDSSSHYKIRNVNSGKQIDVFERSEKEGTYIHQWEDSNCLDCNVWIFYENN